MKNEIRLSTSKVFVERRHKKQYKTANYLLTSDTVITNEGTIMNQREHYQFQELKKWDAELHAAAINFKREYGSFPNILLASNKTYQAIDATANAVAPQNFFGQKGKEVIQKPFSELGGLNAFSTNQYKLEFCIDDKIPSSGFALIRDTNAQIESPKT